MSSVPSRGELYDWEQRHVIGRDGQDLPFYAALTPPGASVLELGCGTGRVTAPVAERAGCVVGLDLDLEMLALARRRAPSVLLVGGDMRRFALHRSFDVVVAAYNCLQLLVTRAEREACLRGVARHLTGNGLFAFEVHDFFGDGDGTDVAPELLHRGSLGAADVSLYGGLRHDRERRLTTYTRRFEISTSAGTTTTIDEDVVLYSFAPGELDDLLGLAGLHGSPEAVGSSVQRWTAQLACGP